MDEMMLKKTIKRVKKNKTKYFELIITEYEHQVYGFVRSIVKDSYEAEDVTQEVFIKLYNKIKTYDEKKPFSIWLLTIARNTALDHIRKNKKLVLVDSFEDKREVSSPVV